MPTKAVAPAPEDDPARTRAVMSRNSVLVRAPAGSGKTALLVQRYLRLLSEAERPEEIIAVTFTRKAAEEMRGRVLEALAAPTPSPAAAPHERRLAERASAVRERAQALDWQLAAAPSRLRITTLDGLALQIVRATPWQGDWSTAMAPTEVARDLYRDAARATLARLEREAPGAASALRALLDHLLADYSRAERELAQMLEKRDQWLDFAVGLDRGVLESAFARATTAELEAIAAVLAPHDLQASNLADWQALAQVTLTQAGAAAKRGLRPLLPAAACAALHRTRSLAPPQFSEAAWNAIEHALEIARLACAELQIIFNQRSRCDFTEITLRAAAALERDGVPTELAARLDSRIRHIFVDEFQDTSRAQLALLHALVADWTPGDGRTLFLVGDAMQSIYGFRNAQVWQFQELVERQRLGPVPLEVLALSSNFRSPTTLVDWTLATFSPPARRLDLAEYLTTSRSALSADAGASVGLHAHPAADARSEARAVVEMAKNASGSVAILGYSRGHLADTLAEMDRQGVSYQGVKLRSLAESEAVRDLLALTRALAQPADRAAWLAVLRAPWCGLSLSSLHHLGADLSGPCLPTQLHDPTARMGLPEPERHRLEAVLPALLRGMRQHGRQTARALVGACWRQIEPAPHPQRAAEGAAYLEWLLAWEERGDQDLDELERQLPELTAPPPAEASQRIQVMTIHAAKGREFDTVLLPALDRPLRRERPWLLRWDGAGGLLAAQAPAVSATADAHHEYLGAIHARLSQQEQLRLLYVAATRARQHLHLFATFLPDPEGNIRPRSDSLLNLIWPETEPAFTATLPRGAVLSLKAPLPRDFAPPLVRVRTPAYTGELPAAPSLARARALSFRPDLPRRVGTTVHALLQAMGESGEVSWLPARLHQALQSAGIAPFEMPEAAELAARALDATLADPRGRWLMAHHQHDHWEWELADASGLHRLDRCFVDAGVRWIVDFKTSVAPSNTDLDQFRLQLRRYARLVWDMDSTLPIRCALYFPMLQQDERWHEMDVNL